MPSTTKKRTARKPATRPVELMATSQEPIELTFDETAEYAQVPVFTINGVTHCISTRPRANLALKMMWLMKQVGEDQAAMQILPEILGDELMAVLMNYEGLTGDQLKQVVERAQSIVFGDAEGSQGN